MANFLNFSNFLGQDSYDENSDMWEILKEYLPAKPFAGVVCNYPRGMYDIVNWVFFATEGTEQLITESKKTLILLFSVLRKCLGLAKEMKDKKEVGRSKTRLVVTLVAFCNWLISQEILFLDINKNPHSVMETNQLIREKTIELALAYSNPREQIRKRSKATWKPEELVSAKFLCMDVRTTNSYSGHIVSLCVTDHTGRKVMETLMRPAEPIDMMESADHGVTDEMVEHEATPEQVARFFGQVVKTGLPVWSFYNVFNAVRTTFGSLLELEQSQFRCARDELARRSGSGQQQIGLEAAVAMVGAELKGKSGDEGRSSPYEDCLSLVGIMRKTQMGGGGTRPGGGFLVSLPAPPGLAPHAHGSVAPTLE